MSVYINYKKFQNKTEQIFQKELKLIKQTPQKSVKFVIIETLKILLLNMSFNNIVIVYVKGSAYRINFVYMSKDDAINMMNGSILSDKRGVL